MQGNYMPQYGYMHGYGGPAGGIPAPPPPGNPQPPRPPQTFPRYPPAVAPPMSYMPGFGAGAMTSRAPGYAPAGISGHMYPPQGPAGLELSASIPPTDKIALIPKKKRAFVLESVAKTSSQTDSENSVLPKGASLQKGVQEDGKLGKRAPRKEQAKNLMFMEDLRRESRYYSMFYPPEQNKPFAEYLPDNMPKFPVVLKEMKECPNKYFNFGFSMQDYLNFVTKHYFVRLERDMIRNSAENFGAQPSSAISFSSAQTVEYDWGCDRSASSLVGGNSSHYPASSGASTYSDRPLGMANHYGSYLQSPRPGSAAGYSSLSTGNK